MVDAYTYRTRMTQPKLVVLGTNDDYYPTDSLNLYWSGLPGPKWVLYLPNADHVGSDSNPRLYATALAFIRALAERRSLPKLQWNYVRANGSVTLHLKSYTAARGARLWTARSPGRDFRAAQWEDRGVEAKNSDSSSTRKGAATYTETVKLPETGSLALFGEVMFVDDDLVYTLSTQVHVSDKHDR